MAHSLVSSNSLNRQSLLRFWKFLPTGGLALFLWVIWGLPALALELRVAIRENEPQVLVGTSNTGVVRNQQGQSIAQVPEGRSLTISAQGSQVQIGDTLGQSFWVEPSAGGFVFIGDRWYRGRVLVTASGSGVTAINYVDLEYYLYSVVGGEMPTSWPLEALKAQAVAARSYVLYRRQRGRQPHYDVGTTTTWQVYKGLEEEAYSTQAAVDGTRHQVLVYNGHVIEAVFHSSSGGHTENVEDVWSSPIPYLRGVQDYDYGAPVFEWAQSFSVDELSLMMPDVGRLVSATPQRTTPRGRIQEIRMEGDRGTLVMTGNDLRSVLNLRSTLFSIAVSGDQVQINGRGYGHGIGMSQWGAHNMAQQGYSYRQILGHYYQGAQLASIEVR
ncbi:SpoIID/LytB domain-containing protein [Oscillatoria sp. CS-180]|uniref:SpoIID/LytB domain-containing protein n=1 Tax=Oscillatoria sp. CS-180 TaxID=3021720 RepID=UPI0023315225|nr:SpoIID/LytB domain-containing protein [Oscillatoria sp. CS-180]MDB9527486.1 SpoIID/LytB domain-containing protein [Oscillatoria sp. CS-180]